MTTAWVSMKALGQDVKNLGMCESCHSPHSEGSLFVLGDILQASDNLSRVINSYKTIIEGQIINGEVTTSTMPDSEGTYPDQPKSWPLSHK